MAYTYKPRRSTTRSIGSSGSTAAFGSNRRSGFGGGMAGFLSGTKAGQAQVASSRERGAPERVEADVMGFVQTAAKGPGHTLERPLSVANTAAKFVMGTPQEEEGPLDGFLRGISGIGFGEANVGNAIGAIGEGIMHVGNAPIALLNSRDARTLAKYENAPDSQVMDEFFSHKIDGPPILGAFGIGGRNMTVGEWKADLARRGWNQEYNEETGETIELPWADVIAKAKTDQFGFGEKAINDSIFVDMAARIGADPFNLLLGAGAIGKATKLVGWATRSPVGQISRAAGSRLGSAFGVGYAADMARAGIRLAAKPAGMVSAKAITAGRMEGATLRGLGHVLAAPRTLLLPGTGNVARRYARGALRMELGLLAVEGASGLVDAGATGVLGEDNVVSGFMEPIHDASQTFLAGKPMSEDITFMMVSAFAMPAIPLLKEDIGAARGAARQHFGDQDLYLWGREFGADTTGLTALKDPMGRRRGKAQEAELLTRLGGKVEFARLIDHIDMRVAFERIRQYSPLVKHFESFDEAMARSRAIGHVVATEAKRLRDAGEISPELRLENFRAWGRAHSRTLVDQKGNLLRDVPQRVDFEISPQELVDQWIRYRDVHAQLAARFQPVGEAILGRANRLTKDDLAVVRSAIASTAKSGRVSAAYVRDLLSQTPAMFEDTLLSPAQREYWTRLMNAGVGATENGQYSGGRKPAGPKATLDAAELNAQLDALIKIAPEARELYHEAARSERKAPADPSKAGAGVVRRGQLRKIYSAKKLKDLRVESNGEIRRLTKDIDAGRAAMDSKWSKKGNLRLTRARPVRQTKPEVSPMGGIDELRGVAQTYNERAGMPKLKEREYWAADSDFGRRTGLAYEALPAVDNTPATRVAYERFVAETLDQYNALIEAGYKIEPWTKKGQPYATSVEMQADVRANKHLYFFTGGDVHPFMGESLAQYGGLTANDIFRAVHDIMTHAQEGYQFGARGELNAAIKHSQMYSPIARRAMLTETHGQNSWVNHGPHNPSKMPAADRPYADQKASLLPDEIVQEFESRFIGETHAVAARKARDAAEALGLTGEQANAAAAVLEARAIAWASQAPGRDAAAYLRRIDFEAGGEPSLEALFQRYENGLGGYRARTAQSAFPSERPLRAGSKFSRRLAARARRLSLKQEGVLPKPGTREARARAVELLPDTEEIAWLRDVARGETLSPEGPGPYVQELDELTDIFYRAVYREQQRQLRAGETLSDDVLFQTSDELVDLIDEPVPAILEEADLGGASPLETIELDGGQPFAIPGGVEGLAEGTFTLWDLHKLKAQAVDPNLIPPAVARQLYAKIFRTHVRDLTTDPLDAANRMAFAMLSPNTNLLANGTIYSAIRMRNADDVARVASAADTFTPQEGFTEASAIGMKLREMFPELEGLEKSVSTNTQLGNIAIMARRFQQNPDFFLLREGESMLQYAERLSAVTPGAALKVSNFGVMLGDPLAAATGTMDSHMMELLGLGNKAPASKKVAYRNTAGEINPAIPEHLRDLPEGWEPKDVTIYGGKYELAHQKLEQMYSAEGFDVSGVGGFQWFKWDRKRGGLEPHEFIFPGAYKLPHMDASARQAAYNTQRAAGFSANRALPGVAYPPSRGFLYQKKGPAAKASTEFAADGTAVIRGLNSPDISSFIHEVGHVFRRDLDGQDLTTAEAHYKVADGAWTREAEEAFARDFERWTRTGKNAPAGLERVFAQLYEWMRQVYRTVLKRDVDPEIGQVFTNLFKEKAVLRLETAGFQTRVDFKALWERGGEPGTVSIIEDRMSRDTRIVELAAFAADGRPASTLQIVFDPATGVAASDGLSIHTQPGYRGQGLATDLYEFAEMQGWQVEQASARSTSTLTAEGRAFQRSRWARQRGLEQTQVSMKVEKVRALRAEVREINKRAEELTTTRIDPSFLDENGNPTVSPESLQALREQTAYVQDTFPAAYHVEKAPKVSYARYQPEDSHLAALMTERSNLAQVLFDYGPIAKATQFLSWLTSPVKASAMAHDSRQMVFNHLLPLKAKTEEVSDFLAKLRDEQMKGYSVGKMNQPLFRGTTSLPPNRIHVLAREAFGNNEGFIQAFEQKYGGLDRMHVMLDQAHNSLMRRVDLKVMRGKKTGILERALRSGYWAWSNVPGLRTLSDASRMVSKVYYPLFRFQMDARWQALNVIEADTIAFFRDGVDGTRFSRSKDKVVRRNGRDVNLTQNAVDFHGELSGMPMAGKKGQGIEAAYEDTGIFLTNQNLAPVLKRSFAKQSLENVDAVLNDMADTDPLIQLIRRKYGDEKGTWADQLNETLYSFDRLGVRRSVDEAVRKVRKYEQWTQAEYDQMVPLINKLVERNQQTFNDLTQIHIGNINRSRLERTMNSYWLYWPLSYQIKATKWMAGVLTNRAFGQQTNLGGAFTLDRAAERVREIARNPEFQQQMEDNEDWWFTASMLLPMAPWDWGVSLNRHVRYVGGNVLGLWPEYAGLEDAGDYLKKTFEMGPVYTMDLIDRFTTQQAEPRSSGPTPTSLVP